MPRTTTWILIGLALAVTACASTRAQQERQKYLRVELESFRYTQTLDEVWPEVRRLLIEKAYPLASADAKAAGQSGGWVLDLLSPAKETREENGIRFLETGWGRFPNRYRVEGSTDERGTRITFILITKDSNDRYRDFRERDAESELELARRLAPDAATSIESGAPAVP